MQGTSPSAPLELAQLIQAAASANALKKAVFSKVI